MSEIDARDQGFDALPSVEDSLHFLGRAKDGDREALNRLLERYHERLLRIVRTRMGRDLRRHVDAEDIVNETFVIAARRLVDFVPIDRSSILVWLDKIARRKIGDWRDKIYADIRNPKGEVYIDAENSQTGMKRQFVQAGDSPSTVVSNAELKAMYDAAVAELAEPYRELVLLHEYAECSWEEVAAQTGKPNAHAAQEAYRRARFKLAELLKAKARPES
jgi:RNA polymerase sigma-70 factor (ECF subfamily)